MCLRLNAKVKIQRVCFAGEGDPYRTNRRFKLVSQGMDAKRLSTAFDSVTLYGADPAIRPDIYGKIGNLRCLGRHFGRHESPVRWFRSVRSSDIGIDDD